MLVNVWLIEVTPVTLDADCPVILVLVEIVQVKVVPAGTIFPLPFIGVTVKVPPEQIAGGETFAITGFGFTVMVIVNGVPGQPLEDGVTVYVAV
jgi:hypothetical protein